MTTNNDKYGMLFVVATPIGNLEDITLRALRILGEVNYIAAEDTRHTRKLLCAHKISVPLISLHEHNEQGKSAFIISKIKAGLNIAYVTDAGTPCISDPGYRLVRMARSENIRIIPVPGVSAVVTALSASGFPANHFVFCGFLPAKESKRKQYLEGLREEEKTIVFYESPNRFRVLLQDIFEVLGDREAVIAREMTKVFEEIKSGRISDFLTGHLPDKTKGEFTIVLRGKEKAPVEADDEEIENKLLGLWRQEKMSLRDAVNCIVQQTGLSRKKVYDLAVKLRS